MGVNVLNFVSLGPLFSNLTTPLLFSILSFSVWLMGPAKNLQIAQPDKTSGNGQWNFTICIPPMGTFMSLSGNIGIDHDRNSKPLT